MVYDLPLIMRIGRWETWGGWPSFSQPCPPEPQVITPIREKVVKYVYVGINLFERNYPVSSEATLVNHEENDIDVSFSLV